MRQVSPENCCPRKAEHATHMYTHVHIIIHGKHVLSHTLTTHMLTSETDTVRHKHTCSHNWVCWGTGIPPEAALGRTGWGGCRNSPSHYFLNPPPKTCLSFWYLPTISPQPLPFPPGVCCPLCKQLIWTFSVTAKAERGMVFVILIDFCMLNQPYTPGINHIWSWCIKLKSYWIQFVSILLRTFVLFVCYGR